MKCEDWPYDERKKDLKNGLHLSIVGKNVNHHGWKHEEGKCSWRETIFLKICQSAFWKNVSGSHVEYLKKEKKLNIGKTLEELAIQVTTDFLLNFTYFKYHILTSLNHLF